MTEVNAEQKNDKVDSTTQEQAQDKTQENKAEQIDVEKLQKEYATASAALEQLNKELEEARKEAKGHQRVASEKQRKIEELTRSGGNKLQTEVESLLEKLGSPEGLNDPTLIKKAQELRDARQRQEIETVREKTTEEARSEIRKMLSEAKLDPEDEKCDGVWDAFNTAYKTDGDFGTDGKPFTTARKRVERLINKAKTENKTEVKTEAKTDNKDETKAVGSEEEAAVKWIQKNHPDWLKSDTNLPSGATSSDAEFVKKFGNGELPMTKANKERYTKIIDNY